MKSLTKLILLASTCVLFSCGTRDEHLNLVLIGVDTLRPDHLSCYGYERDTSPNVDDLAGEGVLFENAVSQAPWTLPSFATVFTSLYPTQHGAVHIQASLRASVPTLAEILRAKAYATGAIINGPYLKSKFKIDRGFDFYDEPKGRVADGATRDALKWIDENAGGPFFMFVHYFDPHLPYHPPPPYDTLYCSEYTGRIRKPFTLNQFPRAKVTDFEEMRTLSPADWNYIVSLYDGEIVFTDEAIGDLLDGLEERGLRKNTLVVFLTDHGEEFFEHEGFEHGHTLYDELIRAGLIFSLPGTLPKGMRINYQARLLDVAPTVLDLLGFEPQPGFEGVSLAPLFTGGACVTDAGDLLPSKLAYSESVFHGHELKSLTAYPWKLIYDIVSGKKACFNLADDPGEHANIADVPSQSLSLLETTLVRTMINISDTWFVEMVSGRGQHTFGIDVTSMASRGSRGIDLRKLLCDDGSITSVEDLENAKTSRSRIEIQGLKVREPVTLALKMRQLDAPVRFDLKIDGESAAERTFIGSALSRPAAMPFIEQSSPEDSLTKPKPGNRPEPPYFLIWMARSGYAGDTTIELDEETKKELRALGYIH